MWSQYLPAGDLRGHTWRWTLGVKRGLDLVGALLCLALLFLVLVVIAFGVWVDSGWPVFFISKRHGRRGRIFGMVKFRTMVRDAEARLAEVQHLNLAEGNQVKIVNDPRCTRIGRLLRRTSLDELPNLLNVIKGDMSLIGPRPHTLQEYPEATPELVSRLQMRPGITGLWQVMARNSTAEAIRAYYDRRYIAEWSLWLDVRVAVRTVAVVLRGRGGAPEVEAATAEPALTFKQAPD